MAINLGGERGGGGLGGGRGGGIGGDGIGGGPIGGGFGGGGPIWGPGPKSENPPLHPGFDRGAMTFAEQGRALPIAWGKVKLPVQLIEKFAPSEAAPPRRTASTAYQVGEYVTVLAYVVQGVRTGNDAVFMCTTGGTTGAGADFTGASLITIGSSYGPDGTVTWKCMALGAVDVNTNNFAGALCEGPIVSCSRMWWDKELALSVSGYSPGKATTLTLGPDAANQTIPSPFDQAAYQHTALIHALHAPAGTQKEIPAIALEVNAVNLSGATLDQSPADILNDVLTHTRRGCSWPSGRVDASITGSAATSFRTYCDAAGLRFSLVLDTQRSALSIIADILAATNSDAVWSGGKLKVVPLGDQSITAPVFGAVAYVPATTAAYNLGADDMLDPVKVSRRSDSDSYNAVPIQYLDRAADYATVTVEDPEVVDVSVRGLKRAGTVALPVVFPNGAMPVMLSRILSTRSVKVRNVFTFRLPWRYIALEPTDIVTLTDSVLGLSLTPVRITELSEGEDGTLSITAEDYPAGVAAAASYSPQDGDGYKANEAGSIANRPLNVGGTGMTIGPAMVTAATILAGCVPDSAGTRTNFANLWPNPTSESAPPDGADTTAAEWAGRTFLAPAWIASHAYTAGDTCTNGGKGYTATSGGTSAGSGGPTGTGGAITDGTAVWAWTSSTVDVGMAAAGHYARVIHNGAAISVYLPVHGGDVFSCTAKAMRASGTGSANISAFFYDKDGFFFSPGSSATTSATWADLSVTVVAPAQSIQMQIAIRGSGTGVFYFDELRVWEADTAVELSTATGDMIYASGANTLARLGIGTTRSIMQESGGIPAWVATLAQGAWTAVTVFTNSWVNYGAGNPAAAYFKDSLGIVHLRGLIKGGTIGGSAFTLPTGYRPSGPVRIGGVTSGTWALFDITTTGFVVLQIGSNVWTSLDGITFDTR